jgi:hypothetical protein
MFDHHPVSILIGGGLYNESLHVLDLYGHLVLPLTEHEDGGLDVLEVPLDLLPVVHLCTGSLNE